MKTPKRISLFVFVVLLPAFAAGTFGWISHRHKKRQKQALNKFAYEISSGHMANPKDLVEAFGPDAAARIITERTQDHPSISFDGFDRWIQVLPSPMANGPDYGDGYALYSVRHGGPLHTFTLDRDSAIQDLVLTPGGLRVTVYGEIRYNQTIIQIPSTQPEVFNIYWPKGSGFAPHPNAFPTSLQSLIFRRYRPTSSP